jgi:large subunit ribosomal protein L25
VARKLRAAGQIPAVLYGAGREATSLCVKLTELEKVLRQVHGRTAFLSLELGEAEPALAVLRELQTDALGKRYLHLDLYEVKRDQSLQLEVTLDFEGEAAGTEQGGVIEIQTREITVEGTVLTIPEKLTVDLSALEVGDSIHVEQIALPEGVTLVTDATVAVASCVMPAVVEEEEPEEEGEEEGESEAEETAEDGE